MKRIVVILIRLLALALIAVIYSIPGSPRLLLLGAAVTLAILATLIQWLVPGTPSRPGTTDRSFDR
jgi:hypothetical protein